MSENDPTMTEVFLADDETKIILAIGSKFTIPPLNAALDLFTGKGRYAVVGQPYHPRA